MFVNANGQSTLKLGHARACALLAPAQAGVPVSEYAATLVKKAVVGVGRAEKEQVGFMVRRLLPGLAALPDPGPDACDALAVGHRPRPPARRRPPGLRHPGRRVIGRLRGVVAEVEADAAVIEGGRPARRGLGRRRLRRPHGARALSRLPAPGEPVTVAVRAAPPRPTA